LVWQHYKNNYIRITIFYLHISFFYLLFFLLTYTVFPVYCLFFINSAWKTLHLPQLPGNPQVLGKWEAHLACAETPQSWQTETWRPKWIESKQTAQFVARIIIGDCKRWRMLWCIRWPANPVFLILLVSFGFFLVETKDLVCEGWRWARLRVGCRWSNRNHWSGVVL
jgi:hypothetical protein